MTDDGKALVIATTLGQIGASRSVAALEGSNAGSTAIGEIVVAQHPGAQGLETFISGAWAAEPELHRVMARHGALYRGGGRWTSKPAMAEQIAGAAAAWVQEHRDFGTAPRSLADGQYGGFGVTRGDGCYLVRCQRVHHTAVKAIGGKWAGDAWAIDYMSEAALRDLLTRSSALAETTKDIGWPTYPGLLVTATDDLIAIVLPSDDLCHGMVKAVPGARWHKESRSWHVRPFWRRQLRKVLGSVVDYLRERDDPLMPVHMWRYLTDIVLTTRPDGSIMVRGPGDYAFGVALQADAGITWDSVRMAWIVRPGARTALIRTLGEVAMRRQSTAEEKDK